MTRDHINMLLNVAITASNTQVWTITQEQLKRFAALVAAAEVERMKSEGWRQCAEGQRTTQFCGLLEEAVAAEREACAEVATNWRCNGIPRRALGDAIRARGNE